MSRSLYKPLSCEKYTNMELLMAQVRQCDDVSIGQASIDGITEATDNELTRIYRRYMIRQVDVAAEEAPAHFSDSFLAQICEQNGQAYAIS